MFNNYFFVNVAVFMIMWENIVQPNRPQMTVAVRTVKNSWWCTEKLSETCRVSFQKQIWEISASSWFYYKNLSRCTVTWTSFGWIILIEFSSWLLSLDAIYKSRFASNISVEFRRETFDTFHTNLWQIIITLALLFLGGGRGAEIVFLMYRTIYYLSKKFFFRLYS